MLLISKFKAYFGIVWCIVGLAAIPAYCGEIIVAHGVSTYGELKYPADFKHLDYVNPDAPKGGELVTWNIGSFDSMHPYITKGIGAGFSSYFFERLMTSVADDPDSLYGLLAETIEYPPSRQWVIFNLRPEARFSDNSQVTAEDVVFTFNILLEKGIPSLKKALIDIEKVEALSPLRVKFNFREGADMKGLLGEVATSIVFSKAHWKDKDFADSTLVPGLGSGPYILDKLDVGRSVRLKYNPDYWGKDLPINKGRNNFEFLREEYFADSNIAFEAFKAGSVLFRAGNSSLEWATGFDFPAYRKSWVIKEEIVDGSLPIASGFFYNLRKEKFKDIRVREALGLMFNFEWSNETLFYNSYKRLSSFWENSELAANGLPSKDELAILEPLKEFFPDTLLTDDAIIPPVSSQKGKIDRKLLRKANKLLDDAGWKLKNGVRMKGNKKLEVEFLIYSSTFERIINPYIDNLKKIGVIARLERVDKTQYLERRGAHNFDILTSVHRMYLIPGLELYQWFGSSNAMNGWYNFTGIENKGIDRLIKIVLAAKTYDEMKIATRALDRALRSLRIWTPRWYSDKHRIAYWDIYSHPKNMPPYALGVKDFWWYDQAKADKLKSQGILN